MKNWIPLTLAIALVGFACATLIHAATENLFGPDYPAPVAVPTASSPEVIAKIEKQRVVINRALANIKVSGESPETVRAAFTNYWTARVCLDLSELQQWEQEEVRLSLKVAHLDRITQLSHDLKSETPTWDLQFVAKELVRGAKATAE